MRSRIIGRALGVALATPLLVVGVTAPALAANGSPHFIKNATSATLSGSTLNVTFKEAGLSSGAVETVSVSATATTVYECVNGGGKNPAASNKKSFTTTVAKTGNFTADKN